MDEADVQFFLEQQFDGCIGRNTYVTASDIDPETGEVTKFKVIYINAIGKFSDFGSIERFETDWLQINGTQHTRSQFSPHLTLISQSISIDYQRWQAEGFELGFRKWRNEQILNGFRSVNW